MVSASYAPDDGDHQASTSGGTGNAQTLVFALADLQLSKTAVVGTNLDGDLLVYTITLRNLGDDTAVDLRLSDAVPAGLVDVLWTCDSSGGLNCPQSSGGGELDAVIPAFPVGGLLNYSFYGNVDGSPPQIVNSASVTLPADGRVQDPNLANNSATVVSLFDLLLIDGFEAPLVTAPSGSYVLATAGLQSQLDEVGRILFVLDDANGHAARIYARVHAGQAQYALAQRDGSGRLRLGAWQKYQRRSAAQLDRPRKRPRLGGGGGGPALSRTLEGGPKLRSGHDPSSSRESFFERKCTRSICELQASGETMVNRPGGILTWDTSGKARRCE